MNKKFSVLIICGEYPPYINGGLGVHYFELINELKKYCNVYLITARISKNSKEKEKHKNLHIYRILIPDIFPLNHIIFNLKTFLISKKIKFDLIHICSPFGFLNAIFKNKPLIVKIHSLYGALEGNFIYKNIFFRIGGIIDEFLINRSDSVLTTSNFMKNEILKKFEVKESKVRVIYNGINKSFFKKNINKIEVKNKLNLPIDKKIILYVGRLIPRKGALNLLKAIPKVIKKYPNILFVFIGKGFSEGLGYEKKIKEYINISNIKLWVRFVSWISRKNLLKYYQSSDILVHPATYEPFGNIILEAMACGLPVIASKSGGPEELIKKNGYLVLNNIPNTLSKAINYLINDKKQLLRLSKSRFYQTKVFSWKENAIRTIKIYKSIINS